MDSLMAFVANLIVPITGIVISIVVHRQSVTKTILEFFSDGNSEKQKAYRKRVYDLLNRNGHSIRLADLTNLDQDGTIAQIVSFYETWGLLQKKHYLPIKTFKGSAGVTAVRMYYILKPYIDYQRTRKTSIGPGTLLNEDYGRDFEKLVKKIANKYIKFN